MSNHGRPSGFDRLTAGQAERFVQLCLAGATVKELARQFGEHESVIKRWRLKLGLQRKNDALPARNLVETEVFRAFVSRAEGSNFLQAKRTVASMQLAAEYLLDAVFTSDIQTKEKWIADALDLLGELVKEPLPEDERAALQDELSRLVADPSRMNCPRRDDMEGDGDSLMIAADRLRKRERRRGMP